MPESELPNPTEVPDPLLDSDSFIQPDEPGSTEQARNGAEFEPGSVIAAEPISMVPPEEGSTPTPKPLPVRRNPEDMAKRPSWLPEDWKIDLKVRTSGATAGLIDRYYVEPSTKRKFRSKNEVLNYLATGSKRKRKVVPEADVVPSSSPQSQKKRKSGTKNKKSAGRSEADQET